LIDAFPSKSASAIAVNNFSRSLVAAMVSLVALPFENAVGLLPLWLVLQLLASFV